MYFRNYNRKFNKRKSFKNQSNQIMMMPSGMDYSNYKNYNHLNGMSNNITECNMLVMPGYSGFNYNENNQMRNNINVINNPKSKNQTIKKGNRKFKFQPKSNNYFYHKPKGVNRIYAEYIISENDANQYIRILNHDEITCSLNCNDSFCNEGTDNKEEIESACTIFFGLKPIKFREEFVFINQGNIL